MLPDISQASSQLDFDYWWNLKGESVEPANARRNGESGVERVATDSGLLYIKRQRNHLFYSLHYPFGLPTVMREKFSVELLGGMGIQVPVVVFAEARKIAGTWQAILVTKDLAGYTDLENWYRKGGRERLGEQQHERFLLKLGQLLKRIHRRHWQHACLYPKHIFITPGDADTLPEIALIDLEKMRRRLLPGHAARRDLDQLRRHSPMWNDQDWKVLLKGHN